MIGFLFGLLFGATGGAIAGYIVRDRLGTVGQFLKGIVVDDKAQG